MTSSPLYAVSPDDSPLSPSALPEFESQPVDLARIKLTGANALDVGDTFNHIDDLVKLYVEGRVTRVDHVVDGRTGKLIRIHTVQVRDAIQIPRSLDG